MRKDSDDPFTMHILGNIDPSVFKTLNLLQLEAIKQAIAASQPYRRHPVDIRMTIPLFFMKLYLVLLMGRDKRSTTRNKEERRKQKATTMSAVFGVYLIICAAFPIIFLALYVVKSFLGIDLFPDQHLSDFFG